MQEQLKLSEAVISEVDLLELLNIEKPALDGLRREKGFPFIRLNAKTRVYLADEVLEWLKQQRKT